MPTENGELRELEAEQIRALLLEKLLEAESEKVVPATAAQRRVWFIDQLEPNTPRYNIPSVVWLRGGLSVPALEKSLQTIVARHEILRTRFVSEDGEPAQAIEEEDTFELRREDLSVLPAAEREIMAKRLIEEEAKRPFILSEGRLMRATLLRINPEEHVLIINMHHTVSDEWSYKIFYRELQTLYGALVKGSVPTLPELPIQYGDFAAWEREWLQSEECERQLNYWREQLAGNPPGVQLPIDRPRISKGIPKGAVEQIFLPPEMTKALRNLGVRQSATLFMVLLAAFKGLLHRLTKEEDIIVGSPMAGRSQLETERLIGFFANTLPLRTRVSGGMTFQELLLEVRKAVIGAFSNQEVPFEKIVETLQPPRSPGQTPFINVLFLFQTDLEAFDLADVQTTFLDINTDTAKFDITLYVADAENALVTAVEYNAEIFERATITRLLQNYHQVLEAIIRNPTQRMNELPLVENDEPNSRLTPWTPRVTDPPRWAFLEEWFSSRRQRRAPAAQ